MNASNGAELIGRIRPGSMVTIRLENGAQLVGRARECSADGAWLIRGADGMPHAARPSNVTRVQP